MSAEQFVYKDEKQYQQTKIANVGNVRRRPNPYVQIKSFIEPNKLENLYKIYICDLKMMQT